MQSLWVSNHATYRYLVWVISSLIQEQDAALVIGHHTFEISNIA